MSKALVSPAWLTGLQRGPHPRASVSNWRMQVTSAFSIGIPDWQRPSDLLGYFLSLCLNSCLFFLYFWLISTVRVSLFS